MDPAYRVHAPVAAPGGGIAGVSPGDRPVEVPAERAAPGAPVMDSMKGWTMRVALAADHAGFALKERLREHLASRGHEVLDLGSHDRSPSDYPDHAEAAARALLDGRAERAILVCGSGVGVTAAANKVPGVAAAALAQDPALEGFTGAVADSGEGRWTVNAAVEEAVPAPVLAASLFARFRSRQASTLGEKLLSALRRQFGGHAEAKRGGGGP